MGAENNLFLATYSRLLGYYGKQAWWPAEHAFEVMVGAILTQNTAWTNVEKAINKLKQSGLCNARDLAVIEHNQLADLIRPSGYFNQKAQRLIRFSSWYLQQGGHARLQQLDTVRLREVLLSLQGIGDETADDIILYAFEKPSFVIDSYTRRIFSRLGLLEEKKKYALLQQQFHQALPTEVELFKQYHALIVSHAKKHCTKKPQCNHCPLSGMCTYHNEFA